MIRVAFFAMFPEDNMATWTFCRWPVDHGAELGIHGRLCAPSGAGLHSRMNAEGVRLRSLRMIVYWYVIVLPRRLWQLWSRRHDDVAFVQRGLLHPKSRPWLEGLLARFGPPIVYHLDDALWVLRPRSYRRRVRLAKRVVTGTDEVAAYASAVGVPVSEVEYPVEVERYAIREHLPGRDARIGWTGSRPEVYLPPVLSAIEEVCRRTGARLEIVTGRDQVELDGGNDFVDFRRWSPEDKFEALAGIDVGILPLEDEELHRGKEPFKVKEYMAHGIPVVASPVGHVPKLIADGQEGFYARDREEWVARLVELVEDPELRAAMGRRGRRLVARSYSFQVQMRKLAGVLRSVAHE